jgi:hypothetical protein
MGYGGADITNEFVAFALAAGLGALALFIVLLTCAYSSIGRSAAVVRSMSSAPGESEYFLWGMGCMLTGHIANLFGITYFDQTYMLWFMQLAAISGLTQNIQSSKIPETEAALAQKEDANPLPALAGPIAVADERLSN